MFGPGTYYSQADYDAARFYNGIYYIDYNAYQAAKGLGGFGGGYETTSSGNDVVYASGSISNVGLKPSSPYELQGGDDTVGQIDTEIGGMQNDDFIKGNEGNDIMWGGSGNDWLKGGDGADKLYGNSGSDVLVGGDGSDIIFGGSGQDVLVGGSASDGSLMIANLPAFNPTADGVQDTFVFIEGEGSPNTTFMDTIADWTDGVDKIAYSADGGTTFIANPFASALSMNYSAAEDATAIYKNDFSEFIFAVNGDVRLTLDDDDVTTVVT